MDKADISTIRELITPTVEVVDEVETEVVDEVEVEDEVEVVDEVETEVVDEVETETEDETDEVETETETETAEPYTIQSLSEAIELPQEDLYGMLIPMEDGEESITLGDMKNKYRDAVRVTGELETKLAEQKTAATTTTESQTQLSEVEQQATFELYSIQREYNDTEWDLLEQADAGTAALQRQKLQERYQAALGNLNLAKQQAEVDRKARIQAVITEGQSKVLELIPEWKDEKRHTDDLADMRKLMKGVGYPDDMINQVADPLAMKLMQELVTLRREKATGRKAVKQIQKAPKVLKKPGTFVPKKGQRVKDLITKAKETGSKADEFAAIKAVLAQRTT